MEEQVCMVFSRADRQKRCRMILDAMNGRSMTAREVAYALGFTERNATAPRLTEMVRDGRVSVVGKVRDTVTGKTVSVYKEVPAWTTL